jgi:RHS repeat-associated protein
VERQSLVRLDKRRVALVVNEARVLALVDDQLGAVRRVVDERGEMVLSADPTPFGTLAQGIRDASSGLASTEMVLGFTGQLRDPDTGLVHMGAREYVSTLASFATPDPYALMRPEFCVDRLLECHPYTYVGHDPVNFTDEAGLMGNGESSQRRSSHHHRSHHRQHGQSSTNHQQTEGTSHSGSGAASSSTTSHAPSNGWNSQIRAELDRQLSVLAVDGNYASAVRQVNQLLDTLHPYGVSDRPAALLAQETRNNPDFRSRLYNTTTLGAHVQAQHVEVEIFRSEIQNFDAVSRSIASVNPSIRGWLSYAFAQRLPEPNVDSSNPFP